MTWLKPGSLPWLLRHELRLALRTRKAGPWAWAAVIVGILFLHGVGVLSAFGFAKFRISPEAVQLIFGAVAIFAVAVMLAGAMQLTVNAFYTRGDMDLLLSSPLPARTIMPVRLLAVAITIMSGAVLTTAAFMNTGALIVSGRWLVGYISLPAVALLATTLSFLMVLGLVSLLGPRRARTVAQVIGGVIGIGAAVAAQIPNMNSTADSATRRQNYAEMAAFADHPLAAPVRWLGAAITGEPMPLAILLVLSLGGFAACTLLLGPFFVRSVNAAAGTDATPRKRKTDDKPVALRVRGATSAVLWKEWRLILRDPSLLTQVASILLVAAPVALPTLGKTIDAATGETLAFAWLSIVPVAGLLAGALVWLALVAEDAPDLLGTAPVAARRLLADRLLAAALPSLVPSTLICLYIALSAPWSALVLWLTTMLGVAVFLLLDMRQSPVSGGRKAFQKRYQGNLVALFAEMLLAFTMFGLAVVFLQFLSPLWAVALLLLGNTVTVAFLILPARKQ